MAKGDLPRARKASTLLAEISATRAADHNPIPATASPGYPNAIISQLRWYKQYVRSQGKTISLACRQAGISNQSYFRWRKEYGGLDLEKENARLKRLVADLSLEKQVLKDIASGNVLRRSLSALAGAHKHRHGNQNCSVPLPVPAAAS